MAEELQIRNSQHQVKIRNPWAVALLPLITLGIYHFVWWYRVNRELRDYGQARGQDLGQSPANSLLALVPGFLVIVPPLVSYWRGTQRIQEAQKLAGKTPLNGWLGLILYLVLSPAFFAFLQVSLNEVWKTEGEAATGILPAQQAAQVPAPAPEAQQPAQQ